MNSNRVRRSNVRARKYGPAMEFIHEESGIAVIVTASKEQVPRFTMKLGRYSKDEQGHLICNRLNPYITASVDRSKDGGLYSGALDLKYVDIAADLQEDAVSWMQDEMERLCAEARARDKTKPVEIAAEPAASAFEV